LSCQKDFSMNRLSMEVPIFFKLRVLWNGPLRNLATQPVSWGCILQSRVLKVACDICQFSFHSRFKLAQSCQKKSNLHTNSLNKLLFAWYSRMENICNVRQQPFEICRMRHELIEIEEYTPWPVKMETALII
jgi:hypothetical protein